jgi:CHAD domain-containing protein
MGSVDESYELLGARYVRGQVNALSRQVAGAKEAKDIECVHEARVASRRLRSALRMFRECFAPKRLKRWRKEVRRVTDGLGPARDKDVQIAFVREFLSHLEEATCRPGIRRLLLRLSQQRAALQPKVVKALDRLDASAVLKDMRAATKARLSDLKAREVKIQSPFVFLRAERLILRRLEKLLTYQDCLSNPADIERHHQMRIVTKRLRYTMEICRPVYEGDLDQAVLVAKEVQGLLGEIHDCDVWVEELQRFEQEERARTVAYYGHAGPFKRLKVGIDHLCQERRQRRVEAFDTLRDTWRRLTESGLWDGVVATVLSRVRQAAEAQQKEQAEHVQPPDDGTAPAPGPAEEAPEAAPPEGPGPADE